MAIQLRRGVYADFHPEKMIAGEVAVVTSGDPSTITGKAIYVCYAPGVVQRFVTDEEVAAQVDAAFVDAPHLQQTVINATDEWLDEHPEATTTVQDGSITTVKLHQYAVTSEKIAENAVTPTKIPYGAINGWHIGEGEIGTDHISDGVITDAKLAACEFTEAATRANINTGETRATIFGKIKKWFTDLAPLLTSQSIEFTNGTGIPNVNATRRGNLVQVRFWGISTLSTGSWQTVITLPAAFRPVVDRESVVIVPQTQSSAPIMVRVTASGALQMYPALNAPTGYISDNYWYFID